MLIRTQTSRPDERKAVILLVVISLLTLFAIVGLTFVLYANAEANASKIYREASALNQVDMEPEMLISMFLSQMIYGVPDDYTGVYSALRGHDLARSMYGYYYPTASSPTVQQNTVPFNGTGRLHIPTPTYGTLTFTVDDYQLVNYTYFPNDGFVREPERLGSRANLGAAPGQYAGGFNVPYTYPDLNNMFLAAVKADGTGLMP